MGNLERARFDLHRVPSKPSKRCVNRISMDGTYVEVGKKVSLSRERVRQIQVEALHMMATEFKLRSDLGNRLPNGKRSEKVRSPDTDRDESQS